MMFKSTFTVVIKNRLSYKEYVHHANHRYRFLYLLGATAQFGPWSPLLYMFSVPLLRQAEGLLGWGIRLP
jgi:hypothetical protein